MVELGAFWAYYSLWFTSVFAAGTVVLVEPDEVNLQVGLSNFALNGWEPPASVHAAVGAQHGETIEIRYESDAALHPVRAVTLEGLAAEQQLARIDLVLCDVQGAEVEMLAGAGPLVAAGRVRFMVVSTHWSPTDPLIHQTCRARIGELGGHIIAEHTIPESCSGDGLIVASFDDRDRQMTIEMPFIRARDSEVGELEWMIASRSGLKGIVWGLVDLVPRSTRERLGASRAGTAIFRRLAARGTVG
jgi:FkbM family methyltransferase